MQGGGYSRLVPFGGGGGDRRFVPGGGGVPGVRRWLPPESVQNCESGDRRQSNSP